METNSSRHKEVKTAHDELWEQYIFPKCASNYLTVVFAIKSGLTTSIQMLMIKLTICRLAANLASAMMFCGKVGRI